MIRFNYLPTRRPRIAARLPAFAIDNRIRSPLAVLFCTLLLTAMLCTIQIARLHACERNAGAEAARIAGDGAALDEIAALRARIVALARLDERVEATRRSSLAHANTLVWIGNHLPKHTWLSALRFEDGGYALEGSADHVGVVGEAIVALGERSGGLSPRLVWVHDDPGANGSRVHFHLRLEPQR